LKVIYACILVLLGSVMTGCAGSRTDWWGEVDALIRAEYNSSAEPGCSVLVAKDGAVLFAQSYGLANLEDNEPAIPQTNYRIASVSKQFTASAVLVLVDQGLLRLDDDLCSIFPDFPLYGKEITVHHLLNHTSGLLAYESLLPENLKKPVLDADVLRIMMDQDEGYFAPGSQYRYSNSGYAVLAMIVETVSGQSYASFLREQIFLPVGMTETVAFENGISMVSNRAYGYRRNGDGGWDFADQSMTSSVLGDGGIYCSITDYAKWDNSLLTDPVISPKLLERAFQSTKLPNGDEINYGYGWRVDDHNGLKTLHHTGGTIGFNHMVMRIPEERLCVAFFANRNGEEPKTLVPKIVDLVLSSKNK